MSLNAARAFLAVKVIETLLVPAQLLVNVTPQEAWTLGVSGTFDGHTIIITLGPLAFRRGANPILTFILFGTRKVRCTIVQTVACTVTAGTARRTACVLAEPSLLDTGLTHAAVVVVCAGDIPLIEIEATEALPSGVGGISLAKVAHTTVSVHIADNGRTAPLEAVLLILAVDAHVVPGAVGVPEADVALAEVCPLWARTGLNTVIPDAAPGGGHLEPARLTGDKDTSVDPHTLPVLKAGRIGHTRVVLADIPQLAVKVGETLWLLADVLLLVADKLEGPAGSIVCAVDLAVAVLAEGVGRRAVSIA